MKIFLKIVIALAVFISLATLSTVLFFFNQIPDQEELNKSIAEEQTPLSRVRNSKTFSKFKDFKGINHLTDEQKASIEGPLRNIDSVLKNLRELEDNSYRIDICAQLENRKIKPYEVKTPGLSYFFRGSYDGSDSRDRFLLGEIYSSPWYFLSRYESFREVYKVIADAFYAILWEGQRLNLSKQEIMLLGTQVSAEATLYKNDIVSAIDKAHHLLKMARLIQYKKDNKYNNDIRDFCAGVEDSIINETDFDYKGEYKKLLEIYGVQEGDFLSQKEMEPVNYDFKVNFGWLRPKVRETFQSKSEKIQDSIESDINK
jgi:hypothetical protein